MTASGTVTVRINASRSGSVDRPLAAPALERLRFTGPNVPAQTSVALLSADGTATLAHTAATAEDNLADLDTRTLQAYAATAVDPTHTTPAVLVIGAPDKLIAAIPVTLVRNPLESITPPTESVPTYPTSQDLAQILAQIAAASSAAEDAAEAAEKSARDAEEALRGTAAAAQDALADIETAAAAAVTDIASAAQDVRDEISADRERAEAAALAAAEAAAEAAAKAALVPAVAVDAEAALQASRNLIGTSGIQLVSLSGTI